MSVKQSLGKVSITPKGTWSASTAYVFLDAVSNNGSSYLAKKNVPAGTPLTDTSYWLTLAKKGDKGDTGEVSQADFEQYKQSVQSEFDKTDLLKEEIFGTTHEINFNSAGQVSSIVHKKGSATYRTDTFTYGTNTITEARTITAIGTLTIVTNLTTLATTVTFTAA